MAMEILSSRHQVDMSTQVSDTADIGITLDLETLSGLDPEDPAGDLARRGALIRWKFFEYGRAMADRMAAEAGMPGDAPETWHIESSHRIENSRVGGAPEEVMSATHNRLDMKFRFRADSAMHPSTLLQLGREQIAAAFADSMMFDLERTYLGKESSDVHSNWETADGDVTAYNAGEQRETDPSAEDPTETGNEAGGRPAGREAAPPAEDGPALYHAINRALAQAERYGALDRDWLPDRLSEKVPDGVWLALMDARNRLAGDLTAAGQSVYDLEKVRALADIDAALAEIGAARERAVA